LIDEGDEMDTNEKIELADLAPANGQEAEVKGGIVALEYLVLMAHTNPAPTSATRKN
jgi:hypothetical protein